MKEVYKEKLVENFDVSVLVDYIEKNNKLIADFLIKNNYDNFPVQIFDLMLRESELLKKVCEDMSEWKKVLEVYRANILSVKDYKNTLYFIKDGEIQNVVLDDKIREELKNKVSLYL